MSAAPVRRAYVDGRHGQLHYRIARPVVASARPLLCFHLSPVSGVVFERFVAEMSCDRVCVAPDTPGYGQSDAPASRPSIADYADSMRELVDALGLGEFDAIGYHTGSKIAVELALQLPARLRHLVLIAAPVYTRDELAQMRLMHGNLIPDEQGTHLVGYWRTLLRHRGPGQSLEMLMDWLSDSLRGGERRDWGHRAAFDWHYADHLPHLGQPVLVLDPEDDLHPYTGRVAPLIRRGRVAELPGWGHGLLDLRTAEVARMVREWTAGTGSGAAHG